MVMQQDKLFCIGRVCLSFYETKKICERKTKNKKGVTSYFFRFLNCFLGHISPLPLNLQVFSRMEFSSSHSRISRGQSTADAAEVRNQETDSFSPWIWCYNLDWKQANVKGCKLERILRSLTIHVVPE